MRTRQTAGFTIVELMIVVTIIGILAGLAAFAYKRWVDDAKASAEIHALFAEFKLRQEQYHVENGEYLSTGDNESDTWPTSPSGSREPTSLVPFPDEWNELRMRPDDKSVYCTYVSIAGEANDDSNIGAKAKEFGFTSAPATDWFYVLAECDFDDDPGENSFHFTPSHVDVVRVQNEGK